MSYPIDFAYEEGADLKITFVPDKIDDFSNSGEGLFLFRQYDSVARICSQPHDLN